MPNIINETSEQIVRNAEEKTGWCLCIFFSVDIEGSTAYKIEARAKNGDDDWCSLFESFYVNLPANFLNQYSVLADNQETRDIKEPLRPVLWKFVGDEILFYAPLTDARQTLEHVRAFRQTIIIYNDNLSKQGIKSRCKGTAWIAGFPVNNRIILIPDHTSYPNKTEPSKFSIIDFIGSSIDCGFRLTKFSSPRRLVVSLDLLWMIAQSVLCKPSIMRYEFIRSKIKYAGQHDLKGVFSGKHYPIFWIDMLPEPTIEDKWTKDTEFCTCEDIIKFCEKLSPELNSKDFIKPFIVDDPSGYFSNITDGFEKQRNDLENYREKNKISQQSSITDNSLQPTNQSRQLTETRQIKLNL